VRVDALQNADKDLPLLFRNALKGLGARETGEMPYGVEKRRGFVREVQTAGPPIGRVGPPLDQAVGLHSIEYAHQSHRVDIRQFGKANLADPLVLGEVAERLALRQGDPEAARALLETLHIEPSGILEEKAESSQPVHVQFRSGWRFITITMIA